MAALFPQTPSLTCGPPCRRGSRTAPVWHFASPLNFKTESVYRENSSLWGAVLILQLGRLLSTPSPKISLSASHPRLQTTNPPAEDKDEWREGEITCWRFFYCILSPRVYFWTSTGNQGLVVHLWHEQIYRTDTMCADHFDLRFRRKLTFFVLPAQIFKH